MIARSKIIRAALCSTLLLVSCGGQTFAIPIHGIERLHRIRLNSVQTVEGKPVIMLDGQPTPLFSMHQLLNLKIGYLVRRRGITQ